MGLIPPFGTNRKEVGRSEMLDAAGSPLAVGLMNAMITAERFRELGKTTEAKIFEDIAQRYRADMIRTDLDPDAIITERARLLTEALQKKT